MHPSNTHRVGFVHLMKDPIVDIDIGRKETTEQSVDRNPVSDTSYWQPSTVAVAVRMWKAKHCIEEAGCCLL
jgi:hypothetical protein